MEKQIKTFDKRIYSKAAVEKAVADFNAKGNNISISEDIGTYNVMFENVAEGKEIQGDFCNYLILFENRRGAAL